MQIIYFDKDKKYLTKYSNFLFISFMRVTTLRASLLALK